MSIASGPREIDVEQRPAAARHRGDDAAAVRRARRRPRRRPSRCARSAAAARCPSIRAAPSSRTGRRDAPAATTPVAPPASATRTIAPTLPGSCTSTGDDDERRAGPQTASRRRRPGGRRARRSPLGDRTGLSASITDAGHARSTSTPRAPQRVDERADIVAARARPASTAACSNRDAGARARRRRGARRRAACTSPASPRAAVAEARDERILAAGDALTSRARIALWYDCLDRCGTR